MELDAESMAMTMRNSLQIELIKLPARVRSMPLKQYLSSEALPSTVKRELRSAYAKELQSPLSTPKSRMPTITSTPSAKATPSKRVIISIWKTL